MRGPVFQFPALIASLLLAVLVPAPARAWDTPLATGNGYGFGVYSLNSGTLSRFYAHPYKFERPDPKDDLGEGIETTNFIRYMYWEACGSAHQHSKPLAKSPPLKAKSPSLQANSPSPQANSPSSQGGSSERSLPLSSAGTDNPLAFRRGTKSEFTSLSKAGYIEESHIIRREDRNCLQYFYMPFELDANVLVTSVQPREQTPSSDKRARQFHLRIDWEHPVVSEKTLHLDGMELQIFQFRDIPEALGLLAFESQKIQEAGKDRSAAPSHPRHSANKSGTGEAKFLPVSYTLNTVPSPDPTAVSLHGYRQWALISAANPREISETALKIKHWQKELAPSALIDREKSLIESWRVKPSVHFRSDNERRLWRQSEVVLRMAQVREENTPTSHNHGLILASLPDGAWFVPWVRDMAYATIALNRMGHKQEARWALESYFNAQPVGRMEKEVGCPYQVSVCRYFGNGAEEPYFTMEGSMNVELDDFGLVLHALGDYLQNGQRTNSQGLDNILDYKTYRGTIFESVRDFVVKPLLANLQPYKDGLIVAADTSIWEERQKDKKHFAFSTIEAINGLKAFERILEEKNAHSTQARVDSQLQEELKTKIPLLEKGFIHAFAPAGYLRGALEEGIKNEVDGAALSAVTTGIVDDRSIILKTVERMQRLKEPTGGYRRVTCILTDPGIFEYWYERQEFVFIDFLMAEIYLKLHQPDKAAALISALVERASRDHFFIPEMYVSRQNYRFTGPIGAPSGAIPMVGYGAGAYVIYLLERDRRIPSTADARRGVLHTPA